MPIIPKYVTEQFHASSTEVGFLISSYAIGLLLLTPVFGILSDNPRVGRRLPMVLGLLGLAGSSVFFMFATSFYLLILARFLQGASAASSWVIGLALVADVYSPETVGSAMGIVMGANGLGMLVGPPVGGFLYEYAGYRSSFILCAGLAVFDLIVRLLLVSDEHIAVMRQQYVLSPQPTRVNDSTEEGKGDMEVAVIPLKSRATFFSLLKDPVILFICGCVLLGSIALGALEPTLPLFLADKFDASSGAIGLVFGAIVIPYVVASSLVGWLSTKINPRILIAGGLPWVGAIVVVSSFMPNIYATGAVLGLCGVGLGFIITPTLPDLAAVVLRRADNNANGQVYAMFNITYAAGSVGGPLVAGVLYEFLGFSAEMFIVGGILALYPTAAFYVCGDLI